MSDTGGGYTSLISYVPSDDLDSGKAAEDEGMDNSEEMKVSDDLINFLKAYEEFSDKPYYATEDEERVGKQTIWYGHVIKKGGTFTTITENEANILLLKDLESRVNTVNKLIAGHKILQKQFDVLVSFEFNTGRLDGSDLLKDVLSGTASDERIKRDLLQYTRQGNKHLEGLWARRIDEWEIYTKGDYKRSVDSKDAPKEPWW